MTYQEALNTIHSLDTFGSRPGLDRIKKLLSILGNPQNSLKFIHVAGTNGKGSTCAMISSTLVEAGYKTGLFISPFITDFCERIQINGKMINHDTLAETVERTYPILLKLREEDCIITEFEYVMALAFVIFKQQNCDVVVLEVGLGGLLDSTNVILPPLVSVITTVGIDHTNVLGNTIEEIARQKCGIIKPLSPVVTSNQQEEVVQIIKSTCAQNNCSLHQSKDIEVNVISQSIEGTKFSYKGKEITLPLIGKHQIENGKTALAVFEAIQDKLPVTIDNIALGFAKATNPARFEVLNKKPLVILDGAHNPNGIEALKNALADLVTTQNNICILGMLGDKDSQSSIELLKGMFDNVIAVNVNNPRNLGAKELAKKCEGYFNNVTYEDDVFEAFDKGFKLAKQNNSSLIICGSLYMAGEIRPYIIKSLKNQE